MHEVPADRKSFSASRKTVVWGRVSRTNRVIELAAPVLCVLRQSHRTTGAVWDFEKCNESFVFAVYSSPGGIMVHGVLTTPMVQLGPIPR